MQRGDLNGPKEQRVLQMTFSCALYKVTPFQWMTSDTVNVYHQWLYSSPPASWSNYVNWTPSHSMELISSKWKQHCFLFLTVGWLLIHICWFSPENQLYCHQLLVPSVITLTVPVSTLFLWKCVCGIQRGLKYTCVNVIPVYHYKYLTRKSYTLY